MRKRMYTTGLAVMCGLVLTATGLWASAASEAEPAAAADREMVRDPATGQMILKPQYGGSLAEGDWASDDGQHTDPWYGAAHRNIAGFFLEKLGIADWALDRDILPYKGYYHPLDVLRPHLAESFEISADGLTFTFHIRRGVHWHDKPPMNGRELVADDIVFSFHRITGLGSGFTEKSPYAPNVANLPIESIEATDEYTVVFKMSKLDLNAFQLIYNDSHEGSWIFPPEVIEQHGHMQDWKTAVGTGPWMLTDWVKGSALTYTKNPNYWGHDEKFPEHRLPYLDEVKMLIIPEFSTRLAALRAGRIARLRRSTFDQWQAIRKTDPELVWTTVPGNSWDYAMDVRKPPFDDIRVRTAMQLALDLEAMNDTMMGGLGDTTPYGILGSATVGFHTPFEEWPQEIKDNYAYDPERAEALLDAAGHPRGADGTRFKTKLQVANNAAYHSNPDHAQLSKDYWAQIGVDVELDIVEWVVLAAHLNAHTYEGMTRGANGGNWNNIQAIGQLETDAQWNSPGVQDPVYDVMVAAARNAGSLEELQELIRKADDYAIAQQWTIYASPTPPGFIFWQPWMVGYNGELTLGGGYHYQYLSRVWIDSDLREEMTGTR